jgi:hypothetical protein
MNFLQKTALKQATAWVKKESEKHPNEDIPKQFIVPSAGAELAGAEL